MTRGFITIATGKKHYYEIAANLLKSYKHYSAKPLPFAIICEEKNEYTALFDNVIITDESTHSFMDKLLLLKLCPYDENIFIDADSLAYGDLNAYVDFFAGATDFSAIGINVSLESKDAWYDVDGIWKYGEMIQYKCRVHSGVMFIRNTEKLKKLYADCLDIYSNYDKLHFRICANSCDEATLGIAMPMNNMKCVHENPTMLAAYPCLTYLDADILHDRLSYETQWAGRTDKGILLHFGTFHTYEPLYKFNVECLELKACNGQLSFFNMLLYDKKLKLKVMTACYQVIRFFRRVVNKLLRQHKDI